jgi:uncharacterized protein (TIGR03067 family)
VGDDARDIQGAWRIVEAEGNGEMKPIDEIDILKIQIDEHHLWAVRATGSDPKLKFSLDPQQSPKAMDLTVTEGNDAGKVRPGIYRLEDKRLKLCLNIFGDPGHRPTDFRTKEGDGAVFVTLERE